MKREGEREKGKDRSGKREGEIEKGKQIPAF